MPSEAQITAAAEVAIRNGCDKAHASELARYMLLAAETVGSGLEKSNLFDDWPLDWETQFRQRYPRKVAMAEAIRKLEPLRKKGVSFAAIMAGVDRYAISVANTEMQYISHPARWIAKARWEDDAKSLDRGTNNGKQGFAALLLEGA